ncbi:MAG: sugar transferase [Pseudolabrys sp.]
MAQVNGYRGRTVTTSDIEQRVNSDLWYIDNWNLALDFKIILMTLIEIAVRWRWLNATSTARRSRHD